MIVPDFDYKQYWNQRLNASFGLEAVGYIGLGKNFNRWMYKLRAVIFFKVLRNLRVAFSQSHVLDVGSGSGFYIALWEKLGATNITGVDISKQAVKTLKNDFPVNNFIELDITEDALPAAQYDLISCMDVLFHVVDDIRFTNAIKNLSGALRKGGKLVLTDNFLNGDAKRLSHHVSRPLKVYEAVMAQNGLRILARKPVFYFLNYPCDSENRLLHVVWTLFLKFIPGNEYLGNVLGRCFYSIDRVVTFFLKEGPSTEIMVCEKQ